MKRQPGYRTPARTLRKLSSQPMIYEPRGAKPGEWDRFHIRNLAFARWPASTRLAFDGLASAKSGPDEIGYLRWTRRNALLRESLLRLGSVY